MNDDAQSLGTDAATTQTAPGTVLEFWFGELDAEGLAAAAKSSRWWKKDPAFDARIRDRFLADQQAAMRGGYSHWCDDAPGRLALVILLDQFTRNMFRDSAAMFEADALALHTALDGIACGADTQLRGQHRIFLYMPLMHSEDLARQRECVEHMRGWHDASTGALRESLESNLRFAIAHHDIIERWGRFPHRNALLGRPSTADELAFLQQPGSSF